MNGVRYAANQAQRPEFAQLEVPITQTLYLDDLGQFEMHSHSLYPGNIRFDFEIKGNQTGMATIDTLFWRNGIEIERADGAVAKQLYADQTFLVPSLLREKAQHFRDLDTPLEFNGKYEFKAFEDSFGRPASATIDSVSKRIVAARSGTTLYQYTQSSPTHWNVVVSNSGGTTALWEIESEVIGTRELSLRFDSPYQEKTPRGAPRLDQIAPGVLRLNGAASNYHSHFVIGDQAIVVFDTPVSSSETAQAKALLEKNFSTKPITHIVLSHTHRDHIGGLTSYAKHGTTVYVGAGGSTALARQFPSQLQARVKETHHHEVIDLGQRRIHLYAVPSSHATDMLVAYDEVSGILFQGDFFTLSERGPVAVAFDVNQELMDFITQQKLEVSAIVGVHGRITSVQELRESLHLRASQNRTEHAERTQL